MTSNNFVIKLHVRTEILHGDPISIFVWSFLQSEWIVFLLHLSHDYPMPTLKEALQIFDINSQHFWVAGLLCYFEYIASTLCLYGKKNLETWWVISWHLIIFIFSLSVKIFSSQQMKCNTVFKVKQNPAYSHMVFPF